MGFDEGVCKWEGAPASSEPQWWLHLLPWESVVTVTTWEWCHSEGKEFGSDRSGFSDVHWSGDNWLFWLWRKMFSWTHLLFKTRASASCSTANTRVSWIKCFKRAKIIVFMLNVCVCFFMYLDTPYVLVLVSYLKVKLIVFNKLLIIIFIILLLLKQSLPFKSLDSVIF